jgi:hypothetical protein
MYKLDLHQLLLSTILGPTYLAYLKWNFAKFLWTKGRARSLALAPMFVLVLEEISLLLQASTTCLLASWAERLSILLEL